MKQKILMIIAALTMLVSSAWADVEINETNFPDENFRAFLMSQTYGQDGVITDAELNNVVTMNVSGKGIKSLSGIRKFTKLKVLLCKNNDLDELWLYDCKELVELDCSNNQLTSLYLRDNTKLEYLTIDNNKLDYINVTNNTELMYFSCRNCRLASIDLSQNPYLEYLYCSGNELTELDVSHNVPLVELDCSGNKLMALDVSTNNSLIQLLCYNNQIKDDQMDGLVGGLPKNNTSVEHKLYVYYADESEGNVCTEEQVGVAKANGWTAYYSGPAISEGWVPYGGLRLEDIAINETNFPDENFRNYLRSQYYGIDGIITRDEIKGIDRISVYNKGIKSLKGIEFFTEITTLECPSNELTELDVSNNTKLFDLSCGFNKLRTIDTSKNKGLVYLFCGGNMINQLDLSQNEYLSDVYCFDNRLEELDVSHNPNLLSLGCQNNQLREIDVSHNYYLQQLICNGNRLKTLDLSNCPLLNNLACFHNDIYGKRMDALIASLPEPDLQAVNFEGTATFYVISYMGEGNHITVKQVEAAKAAGWTPLWFVENEWEPYPGSEYEKGDINKDGHVNSADVQRLYYLMAHGGASDIIPEADLNGDGKINSADVQKAYTIMAEND